MFTLYDGCVTEALPSPTIQLLLFARWSQQALPFSTQLPLGPGAGTEQSLLTCVQVVETAAAKARRLPAG
jgi:hypothetical protein